MKVAAEEKINPERFMEKYFPPPFTYFKAGNQPINEGRAPKWMDV